MSAISTPPLSGKPLAGAPRFALFSDKPTRARAATFGGACPEWAVVYPPEPFLTKDPAAAVKVLERIAKGTPALLVLFDRDSADARAVEALFNDMRARGRVIGLEARQLKGLGEWLTKNGRCAGEPLATLIAAGCDVASVKISDNQEAA